MYIYKTTNLINNKVYIGKSSKNFNSNYLGSGKIINSAIKKYGKHNFIVEVIEFCKCKKDLDEREIYWISFYKKDSYNLAPGGTGGDIVSFLPNKNEIYKKISKTNSIKMIGHKVTDSTKKKISEASKKWNKSLTEDQRNDLKFKISEFLKLYYSKNKHHSLGKKLSDEHKEKLSKIAKKNNFGGNVFDNMSEEQKQKRNIKLSNSLKGRVVTEETKQKIRLSLIGRPCSEEKKQKIKETLKKRYGKVV